MTDALDRTLPYGQVRAAVARAIAPQRRIIFDGAPITPDVERRFAPPPAPKAVAASPVVTAPSAAPRRPAAPRHAPPIRIAHDVHPVADLAESIELFGQPYLERIFTALERAQCEGDGEVAQLAGRLAAKEAVLKVLDLHATAVVPWQAVEVRTGANGVAYLVLTGRVGEVVEERRIARVDISLSCDAGMAMAVAAAIPAD